MPDIHLAAVAVATIAAFIASAAYYMLLGDQLATVSTAAGSDQQPSPWMVAVEVLRSLVVCIVVAGLAIEIRANNWSEGMLLGLVLWVGFPLVLWAGAMLHERSPWKLAAIHSGDWLIKLVAVGAIVSAWQ